MPNRATELEWEVPAERAEQRRPLVEAALALADRDGLDAVSIRAVAAALGMRPMSVYTHVASKDDLVALMFDAVSAGLLVPEPIPAGWREALAAIARRAYAAYLDHPWMLAAFGRRPPAGPNQMRRGEQAARAVAQAPFAEADRWAAVGIVYEWTLGHAVHAITLREDRRLAERLERTDPDEYPAMAAALEHAPDERFERALAAVLDGIEARFASGA